MCTLVTAAAAAYPLTVSQRPWPLASPRKSLCQTRPTKSIWMRSLSSPVTNPPGTNEKP
jgi:hypothetical protein